MKVIARPKIFEPFVVDCVFCRCKLEIEQADIQYHFYGDQREGTEEYFYVECCECKTRVQIDRSSVPPHLQNTLRKAKRGY